MRKQLKKTLLNLCAKSFPSQGACEWAWSPINCSIIPLHLAHFKSGLLQWLAQHSGCFVADLAHRTMRWLIRNHIHLFIYPSVCPPTYDLSCRLHNYSIFSVSVCRSSLYDKSVIGLFGVTTTKDVITYRSILFYFQY